MCSLKLVVIYEKECTQEDFEKSIQTISLYVFTHYFFIFSIDLHGARDYHSCAKLEFIWCVISCNSLTCEKKFPFMPDIGSNVKNLP